QPFKRTREGCLRQSFQAVRQITTVKGNYGHRVGSCSGLTGCEPPQRWKRCATQKPKQLSSLRHHRSAGSPAPPKTEFFISLQLQALLGDRSRGLRGRGLQAVGAEGQCLDLAVISLGRKPFTIEGNVQSAHIACSQ